MCDICDTVEQLEKKRFSYIVKIDELNKYIEELEKDYKIVIANCSMCAVSLIEHTLLEKKDYIKSYQSKANYYQKLIDYRQYCLF